jgi:hypothetical protein
MLWNFIYSYALVERRFFLLINILIFELRKTCLFSSMKKKMVNIQLTIVAILVNI